MFWPCERISFVFDHCGRSLLIGSLLHEKIDYDTETMRGGESHHKNQRK